MKQRMSLVCLLVVLFVAPGFSFAEETVAQLKERIIDIQNKGTLGFRNFTLCSNIIGYGQYVSRPDNKVKAGSKLLFYYEPVNLYTNRRQGSYHTWYTQDMIITTEDGKEIYSGSEMLNFNYQTTSPVLDIYATNTINLGKLPPGIYKFKAIIHDKLKKADASRGYTFEIVP